MILPTQLPRKGSSSEDWWKIGAAIYSEFGASGFSIWDYWSAKSSKYSPRGMNEEIYPIIYKAYSKGEDIRVEVQDNDLK